MSKDPVCGMEVKPEKAAARTEHAGQTYYFCSDACLKKFQGNPGAYAKKTEQGHGGSHHGHR